MADVEDSRLRFIYKQVSNLVTLYDSQRNHMLINIDDVSLSLLLLFFMFYS